MFLSVCSLMLTLSVPVPTADAVPAGPARDVLARASSSPIDLPVDTGARADRSRFAVGKRPGALPILYGSLGALQALDAYSTRRALAAGAREVNPIVARAAASPGTMLAVKAISTATSIYFAERAWKKNRKGAVVLMALINGVTAAVVAKNLRHAR